MALWTDERHVCVYVCVDVCAQQPRVDRSSNRYMPDEPLMLTRCLQMNN